MDNKKNGIPKLRFPGFTGAWEQRKLGEILKERKERSSIGELISVTINNGVVKADSLERKDNSSSDKSNYKVVCKGDIAYNSMRMWQGASGYSPYNGILSPAYTVLIPTEKVDSKFISYMFKKEKMLQQFQKYSQGLTSDTWNLKYPMLKDIPVLFPKIDEQVSIRKHLDNISSLIALHQRKLEHLQEQKKGLLQKMFPKNGETVPEVRFPGFTDAWEQRKFGGVFSILKNNTLSRANLSDEHGAAQDIHYGDILTKFNETLDISTTAVPYIQNEEVIEKTKATLLKNGDIVLADTAEDETAGKCTEIVGLVNQKVFAGLHTIPLRPNQSFSKGFLGFYMNSIAFRDQLKSLMQGIKVLSISKKALKETVISFPHDLREQEKIGQHLSNIDTLIALHQRKLEHLELMKKGLLQQMFV